jgi:hypothetical protein
MATVPFTSIYPDGPATAAAGGIDGSSSAGGNSLYPGMPEGATPIHRDVLITTATTTSLWTPGAGRRFVLASAFVSSDTAMRVAIVDDADIQGSRPVDQYVGANGGSSPNLVPVPYVSKAAGNSARVVTSAVGNVRVRVSGWEVDG